MSVLGNNILAGASGQGGYFIDRSLRFRSSASAYLSRTPASAGNRKTWTWSGWVKFGSLTATFPRLFSAGTDANNRTEILFITNTNQIRFLSTVTGTSRGLIDTVAYLRDPSAWYHLVVSLDASSTTLTMYINGVQQTLTTSTAIANVDHMVNSTNTHSIGRYFGAGSHFDGYMTEVNFIDGQALDPTYFGEYNEDTGVWQPIKYTGTYGTNGFYLNFSDNTSTTTLGYDTSGNSNNWTANNISVTAGATYDSMTDVPTLTSEDAANYATLNPLFTPTSTTISNGNLRATKTGTIDVMVTSTIAPSTGKFYCELTLGLVLSASNIVVGLVKAGSKFTGSYDSANAVVFSGSANVSRYGTALGSVGTSFATNDVIGLAYDADTLQVTLYKNNTSIYTVTGLASEAHYIFWDGYANTEFVDANFGQRPFAYTPPAGFKSLNTYNLPDSTIEDGSQYFNTVTYTGTLSTVGSNQLVTGVGFQPDMTWIKSRSNSTNHIVADVLRYVSTSDNNTLSTNTTGADADDENTFRGFASDGFNVGYYDVTGNTGKTYVAWNWKANGSGVSNTDGSITSTVSANTTSGFSIVTYTGTGANATVGHGLGVAPSVYFLKSRNAVGTWVVYTTIIDGSMDFLELNSTAAKVNSALSVPSSTILNVGGAGSSNGITYVAYCFADVEGYSKFGSYTGNGSADGPFVYTGFRPAFILVKRTNLAEGWEILDTSRNTYNPVNSLLEANQSSAEITNTSRDTDYLANGFKVRNTSNAMNASGSTYIFAAFAENPFKNSLAR